MNNVPINNLNIAFIGEVSTGKSTLLNAIFSNKNELAQTSIKRTTMLPTVFVENNLSEQSIGKEIYEEIKKKNLEIIKETETGITLETCNELVFNVGKLDIKILDNYLVNVYDIPGLNDARTKNTYYEYLRNNFFKFNIVIFLVDIHSGLNTSDEIDILRLITNYTKHHKDKTGKDIFTLVVVNKADDMQIKVDEKTGKEILYIDDELNEMYEQVKLTVNGEFKKLNITKNLIDIIPLCGIDAYLYRMIKKYSADFELKDSDILKIGINQMGKKFSKKTKENQRKEVLNIVNDVSFVDDMIKLSGFEGFEKTLYSFLQKNIKNILTTNIIMDINSYPSLYDIFNKETDISVLIGDIDFYMLKIENFKNIDTITYSNYLTIFYTHINEGIQYIVENTPRTIFWLKEYYDNIYVNIILKYFNDIKCKENYPIYLKERILNDVIENFNKKKVNITTFTNSIKLCISTKIFKSYISEKKDDFDESITDAKSVLNALITNVHCYGSIHITIPQISDFIGSINMLNYFYLEDTNYMKKFIRFVLLNSFQIKTQNSNYLLRKKMFFDNNHEVIMSNYLMLAIIKNNSNSIDTLLSSNVFLDGFIEDECENENKLEQFYIDLLKK